jgi:hypothetical protein
MSKTIKKTKKGIIYQEKDNKIPKKNTRKFMGWTSGTHTRLNNGETTVKGVDYIKYGYPEDFRRKEEIQEKIEEKIEKELLNEVDIFFN